MIEELKDRPREEELATEVVHAAVEVHRTLGPGLMEGAYEIALCHELSLRALPFQRQLSLPVNYKGVKLDAGYRIDVLVDDAVIVELKAVECLTNLHTAQLLTYLKLYARRLGLLLNFNVPVMKQGIKRVVNGF